MRMYLVKRDIADITARNYGERNIRRDAAPADTLAATGPIRREADSAAKSDGV
jgi:hypothetical protein